MATKDIVIGLGLAGLLVVGYELYVNATSGGSGSGGGSSSGSSMGSAGVIPSQPLVINLSSPQLHLLN